MKNLDPEKREEWDVMLEAPLPGQEQRVTQQQMESEGEGFLALMGMAGAQEGIAGGS